MEITSDQSGQRIDNFLLAKLKGVPKSHVYRILRKGEVRVNKGRVKPVYRLCEGDVVRIPPVRYSASAEVNPHQAVLEAIERNILYEDKSILVINKPSGMAVHGGSGLSYGVIEALRKLKSEENYLELVHRLDRETSGCLLVAKKRSLLRNLHDQLRNKLTDKRYLALLQGCWRDGERVIDKPLLKNVLTSGERIVRVNEQGKTARSIVRPLECRDIASLVEMEPVTGRTHQLRVHAASVGHAIAGDEKYGDEEFNKLMRKSGLKRLFLHARSISFENNQGQGMTFTAPLPGELNAVLKKLDMGKCDI